MSASKALSKRFYESFVPAEGEDIEIEQESTAVPAGYVLDDNGVWYDDNGEKRWVCSKLEVVALTRSEGGKSWGRLLEVTDLDGVVHTMTMPERDLDGEEYRRELRSLGLRIASGRIGNKDAKLRLYDYLNLSKPPTRAICTEKPGWNGRIFVLPHKTFGDSKDNRVLLQPGGESPEVEVSGELKDWRDNIGKLCAGNSRLILAVCTAFAGPLLRVMGLEGGGLHLQSGSSQGKTTALLCATSVYGSDKFMGSWRMTDNSGEGICEARNDLFLPLDEINQVDPVKAGEMGYMFGNGIGKGRSAPSGDNKKRKRWRVLYLSTGEIDLADQVLKAGQNTTAGQEVRMLQIDANPGCGLGIYETLHGFAGGAELSLALVTATQQFYGTAGDAWLERLVKDYDLLYAKVGNLMEEFKSAAEIEKGADGQVFRAAQRFAIIAAAGELATEYGITGWKKNEAIAGVNKCFQNWIQRRGGTQSQEAISAITKVKGFLTGQEHRFKPMKENGALPVDQLTDPDDSKIIRDQVGFIRRSQGATEWLCYKESFRSEICKGVDAKTVKRSLEQLGAITEKSIRLTNTNPRKFYIINENVFNSL